MPKGNRRATIAGVSDPEDPNWEANLLAMVARSPGKRGRADKRPGRISAFVDPEFMDLLHRAADRRGMAYAAYIRRSIAAFIASDLGLPLSEVTQYAPAVLPTGGKYTPLNKERPKTVDDGMGYGDWGVNGG